jgi:hypothetical protein
MKTPAEEIRDANAAHKILNDPLFVKAFDGIQSGLIDKMRQVPMGDVETQHQLVLSLQLLHALKNHFSAIIQTGKMAEIQQEQSLAQKVKRFVRN